LGGRTKIKAARSILAIPQTHRAPSPATCQARIAVDGITKTAPLKVTADPCGNAAQADLETQLAFALRVRGDISRLTDQVNRIRSVREHVQARAKLLEPRKSEGAVADLLKLSEEVVKSRVSAKRDGRAPCTP
jgi:hypothetical protein